MKIPRQGMLLIFHVDGGLPKMKMMARSLVNLAEQMAKRETWWLQIKVKKINVCKWSSYA